MTEPAPGARALLAAARLPADDTEIAGFDAAYAGLRRQADALYLPFLEPEAPAFAFDAAFPPTVEDLR